MGLNNVRPLTRDSKFRKAARLAGDDPGDVNDADVHPAAKDFSVSRAPYPEVSVSGRHESPITDSKANDKKYDMIN